MSANDPVLVVEPAPEVGDEIASALRLEGHAITVVSTARAALEAIAWQRPLIIVCDDHLPDLAGTALLRRIRQERSSARIPVLMTSTTGDEVDRVAAFELGADDYLVKPFSVRELALRVRAILRRVRPQAVRAADRLRIGPLEIDVPRHRVTVDGETADVTPLELRLLAHLATRPGRVQSREILLERVWEQHSEGASRAVDTSIKRLRQKLGHAGAWIETVRGVGYRLRDARPGAQAQDQAQDQARDQPPDQAENGEKRVG